jgi:hypothetical protein
MTGPALPPESTWKTEWTAHRQPDAVRAAALAAAVQAVAPWPEDRLSVVTILAVAKDFEAYLAGGQEADGEG